jgi:hypothetical protein
MLRHALADRGGDPARAAERLEALRREPRPSRFVRARADGAIRFVHPAEPEPVDLMVEERTWPGRPAFVATPRFILSYRSWAGEDPAARPGVASLLSQAATELGRADGRGDALPSARAAVAGVSVPGWASQWAPPKPAQPVQVELEIAGVPRRSLPLMRRPDA